MLGQMMGRAAGALTAAVLGTVIFITGTDNAARAQAGNETLNCVDTSATVNKLVQLNLTARTCTIIDGALPDATAFSPRSGIVVRVQGNAFNIAGFFFDDNGSGAAVATRTMDAQRSCTLDGSTFVAGQRCDRVFPPVAATRNVSISETGPNGEAIALNLDVVFGVGPTSVTINNVVATIPPQVNNNNGNNNNNAAVIQDLQRIVSRSQASVSANNIGQRVRRATRQPEFFDLQERENQNQPAGQSFAQSAAQTFAQRLGFRMQDENGVTEHQSRRGSFRDLVMAASFDTSDIKLSAAGDEQSPTRATVDRLGLGYGSDVTIWGHGSFTSVDNDRNRVGDDQRFNGDVWGYNLGADYRFSKKALLGMSAGFADTDLETNFNGGSYKERNWTLSPYALLRPMENLTLSAIGGYSFGDIDTVRAGNVTGSTNSRMLFASLTGSYLIKPSEKSPLDLTLNASYLVSRKTVESFTESDGTVVAGTTSNTSRVKAGVEAAYGFTLRQTRLQPFVKADYVRDFADDINGDETALNLGGGLRLASGSTGLSGSIQGETQLGRSDYSEYSISGLIAYGFRIDGARERKLGLMSPYVSSGMTGNGQQTFGAGINFTGNGGMLTTQVGISRAVSATTDAVTSGQVRLQLKF